MPLPQSVCRLETADEVKCGNATDKALAGEVLMEYQDALKGFIFGVLLTALWFILYGNGMI